MYIYIYIYTLRPRLTNPRIRSKITDNEEPFSTVRTIRSSSPQRASIEKPTTSYFEKLTTSETLRMMKNSKLMEKS